MERKKIISKIIEEQQKIIDNLKQSVNNYKTASDMDEESTHDVEDYSHQSVAKDMQLRFEKLLGEAEQNMIFLENEKEMKHTEIENGSLVATDQNYLFVGVSVPVFEIGNRSLLSFSEDAPIFLKLKDKSVGDRVQIGETLLTIQEIA